MSSADRVRSGGPALLSLRIRNLRNLRSLTLESGPGIKEIRVTGPNGSGKTTLIEAIYLLARGRSFRGRKAGGLTTTGEARTLVEGRLLGAGGYEECVVAFERDGRGSQHRINGSTVSALAPRDQPFRVKLIGENSQSLLDGEPSLRRTLLDWNLFHVEHVVGGLRANLKRVLAQRNAALRARRPDTSAWDPVFIELSLSLTARRADFVERWRGAFSALADEVPFLHGCELVFSQGWSAGSELSDALAHAHESELDRGQTLVGAHRADISIRRDDRVVSLSRGQAKIAICLLQLAAERVHIDAGLDPSLWLLDDIEAELDECATEWLHRAFETTDSQRILAWPTSRARQSTDGSPTVFMFHVEHGERRRPMTPDQDAVGRLGTATSASRGQADGILKDPMAL